MNITGICPKCSAAVPKTAKFCGECGVNLTKAGRKFRFGFRESAVLFCVATSLFLLLLGTKRYIAHDLGEKPVKTYAEHFQGDSAAEDKKLVSLRNEVEKDPQNLDKLRRFALALGEKITSTKPEPQRLTFELMNVFKRILAIDPKDAQALLSLANISFSHQVFDKSLSYYERFLELEPKNSKVRMNYATALTFTGEHEKAEKELRKIEKENPSDFSVKAGLAINYASAGDKDKALAAFKEAEKLTSNRDSTAELKRFIDSLISKSAPSAGSVATQETSTGASKAFKAAADLIRANPVAGSKLVNFKEGNDKTLELFFADFPMSNMPPFARERFFNSIKSQIAALPENSRPSKIEFFDHKTGAKMETLEIE